MMEFDEFGGGSAPAAVSNPTCQVCGQRASVGVASSPLGAFSVAYCVECLKEGAEPLWACHATLDSCGPEVADWVRAHVKSYKDGAYIAWPAIAACWVPEPDPPSPHASEHPRHNPVHSEITDDGRVVWYFWDETWSDRWGPYATEARANRMLDFYAWWFLGAPLPWYHQVLHYLRYVWIFARNRWH